MTGSATRRLVTVNNPAGLHMRPAVAVARCAQAFRAAITISLNGRRADGKSPIALLTLIAVPGSELIVEAFGDDAQEALDRIAALLADPGDSL